MSRPISGPGGGRPRPRRVETDADASDVIAGTAVGGSAAVRSEVAGPAGVPRATAKNSVRAAPASCSAVARQVDGRALGPGGPTALEIANRPDANTGPGRELVLGQTGLPAASLEQGVETLVSAVIRGHGQEGYAAPARTGSTTSRH